MDFGSKRTGKKYPEIKFGSFKGSPESRDDRYAGMCRERSGKLRKKEAEHAMVQRGRGECSLVGSQAERGAP